MLPKLQTLFKIITKEMKKCWTLSPRVISLWFVVCSSRMLKPTHFSPRHPLLPSVLYVPQYWALPLYLCTCHDPLRDGQMLREP